MRKCYRASWQLPGPDFHRQATSRTVQEYAISPSAKAGAALAEQTRVEVAEDPLGRQPIARDAPHPRPQGLQPLPDLRADRRCRQPN